MESFLKSEQIPAKEMDGFMRNVVGKTFNNTILNNDMDVVLGLISGFGDECGKVKEFLKKGER